MKYRRIPVFLLFLLTAHPVLADAGSPQEAFALMAQCVRTEEAAACREHITASSVQLYDRFVSYGLMPCLPKDVAYVSEERHGNQAIISASTTNREKKRIMRLIFVEEGSQWKLDAPGSLHAGLGDKWEQQLNLTEQLYVMMRQQMGPQLNCSMIQNLAQGNH